MLLQAAEEHQLNLERCVVIGDRWSDMLAGDNAHAKTILVLTGAGKDALGKHRGKWQTVEPLHIAQTVLDAVEWLLA